MNNNLNEEFASLSELTDIAIEEQKQSLAEFGNLPSQNMTRAIREQLPVWENKLFPLLKSQKVSQHQFIAELLLKAGYKDVTANHVCVVISKIRREKKSRG